MHNFSQLQEISLRPPKAGEYGWIMQQFGKHYWAEYNWNDELEMNTGLIICNFMRTKDKSPRSKLWIGAINDKPMGSILLEEEDSANNNIGKLQLFFVSPEARGFGLGTKLLVELIEFAKNNGYKKLRLD